MITTTLWRRIAATAAALTVLLVMMGCTGPGEAGAGPSSDAQPNTIEFPGKIVHVALEGGFYGLVAEDGRRFQPRNLPPEFRVDGLQVTVLGRPLPARIGFRMWGTQLEILTIERR